MGEQEKPMIVSPARFWTKTFRDLYPSAEELPEALERNRGSVIAFIEHDLDQEFDDPERKKRVEALLAQLKSL